MKLKNSYILLIVMSIFLLIGIGSVCASDAAMDADVLADGTDATSDVLTATPVKTTVDSQNVVVSKDDPKEIPVTVKDNESQAISIVKGDLNVTEGNKTMQIDYDNSIITIKDTLNAGNHSLIINYLGNENYAKSSANIILSIVGDKTLEVPESITVNGTEKAVIPIKLTDNVNYYDINKDNLDLIVSYKDGNNTINKKISEFELNNGNILFQYNLNVTACNVTINYIEGNKTLTKNVALKKVNNAKIIPLNLEAEYASGTFTFKLVDVDTNKTLGNKKLSYTILTGSINTGGSVTTDADGIATVDNSKLTIYKFENNTISTQGHINVGKQAFSMKGDDSSIKASEIKSDFTVTQATINIKINPYKEHYGSNKKVVINVTNAKTGAPMSGIILHLYMVNTTQKDYYFQTTTDGIAEINVTGLIPGVYPYTVSNNDTVNMKKKSVDGSITILTNETKMTVTVPSTYYYNSGTMATIKITDKATGKAAANAIVLVQVYTGKKSQGYLYQANEKGIINVNYAPASIGTHKIVISMADSRYTAPSVTKSVNVKKATAKLSSNKINGYYKDGKNLIITLKNTKNNKGIYAAKLNIKIFPNSKSYYDYNGQTGQDGKLRITLKNFKPGTYKVIVTSADNKNFTAKQITTKIVLKKAPAKITPTKLTAKKGADKYFKVTVKNTATKKVITGVKIKFKVYTGKNVKTYTATTNSQGIAKISSKALSVGSHKVVITSGNKYVSAKSATSTIKITKT